MSSINYDPSAFQGNITPRPSIQKGDILTVIDLECNFIKEGVRKNGSKHNAMLNFEMSTDDGLTFRHCVVFMDDVERMQRNFRRLDQIQSHAFGGPVVKKACKMETLAKRLSSTEVSPFQVTITNVNDNGICNIFVGELELSDEDQEDNGSSNTEASAFPVAE